MFIVSGSVVAHGKIATSVKGVVCGGVVVCAKKWLSQKLMSIGVNVEAFQVFGVVTLCIFKL